jgi:hypothetical protein
MNSTQHSINRSRVSLAKDMDCAFSSAAFEARTSLMIFCTVAAGRFVSLVGPNVGLSMVGLVIEEWLLVVEVLMRSWDTYLLAERGRRCLCAGCQCRVHCIEAFTFEAVCQARDLAHLRYLCLT